MNVSKFNEIKFHDNICNHNHRFYLYYVYKIKKQQFSQTFIVIFSKKNLLLFLLSLLFL